MSKINLTPNASGTGVFTIASPNSNTNYTINLPEISGGAFVATDASGNVGIGTASPATLLDVASSGEVIGTVRSTSTSGARQATLRLNVASSGVDDPAGKLEFTY